MAKAKQNLNFKIQMLAGKEAEAFFERFYKNHRTLVKYGKGEFRPKKVLYVRSQPPIK